jgi:hypothetical protein
MSKDELFMVKYIRTSLQCMNATTDKDCVISLWSKLENQIKRFIKNKQMIASNFVHLLHKHHIYCIILAVQFEYCGIIIVRADTPILAQENLDLHGWAHCGPICKTTNISLVQELYSLYNLPSCKSSIQCVQDQIINDVIHLCKANIPLVELAQAVYFFVGKARSVIADELTVFEIHILIYNEVNVIYKATRKFNMCPFRHQDFDKVDHGLAYSGEIVMWKESNPEKKISFSMLQMHFIFHGYFGVENMPTRLDPFDIADIVLPTYRSLNIENRIPSGHSDLWFHTYAISKSAKIFLDIPFPHFSNVKQIKV